jgi:hypothetical protein
MGAGEGPRQLDKCRSIGVGALVELFSNVKDMHQLLCGRYTLQRAAADYCFLPPKLSKGGRRIVRCDGAKTLFSIDKWTGCQS